MRHVPDRVLRRLVDEPFAVPDRDVRHLQRCTRCQAHHGRVADDAVTARELFARPHAVPDVDVAWERLARAEPVPGRHVPRRIRPRRLAGATGVALVSGALVAGVAAAATLTVVFSPTHVAPLPVSTSDLQSLSGALGLSGAGLFATASTSASTSGPATSSTRPVRGGGTLPHTWAYGTIQWENRPHATKTSSLATAEAAAGMTVPLPSVLPAGVQGQPSFLAVPESQVSVTFGANAGPSLEGSTLTLTLGPGVLAQYGGVSTGTGTLGRVPTLVVAAMARPTATSTGASLEQLEAFVFGRPGFPKGLADELHLLGNLGHVLPVPVPSGMTQSSTSISGSPAVLLSADGGAASGVVWEHDGVVRTVGGLLSGQDVMDVARQLG